LTSLLRSVVIVSSSIQPWLSSRVTTTISGPSGSTRRRASISPTLREVKYWFSM
jgi:hypothetical protein